MVVDPVVKVPGTVAPAPDSGKPLIEEAPEPHAKVAETTEAAVPLDGINCGDADTSSRPGSGAATVKVFVPSWVPPAEPPLPGVATNCTVIVIVAPAKLLPLGAVQKPAVGELMQAPSID
jgi:hypothetical protein